MIKSLAIVLGIHIATLKRLSEQQAAKEHIINHLDDKSDWNPDLVQAVVNVRRFERRVPFRRK